ncbi:hypothetical protein DNTS_021273, partial [Danionella cerebrum]
MRCLSRNFLRLIQQISKSESKTRAYEQSTDRERNMSLQAVEVVKGSRLNGRDGVLIELKHFQLREGRELIW